MDEPETQDLRIQQRPSGPSVDHTGAIVAHYRVGQRIGAGGMGTVHEAVDTTMRRPVALKFLGPELCHDDIACRRFLREAQACGRLDHPNIGAIHDVGVWNGQPYIVMPRYEGETLEARIKRGKLELAEIERILGQIAEGLAAAHAAGVIHRDLKAANVMLLSGGSLKILDFGVAKLVTQGTQSISKLTESGEVMGTVAYMSPEQARGEKVDHRTDLWSAGVLAYEMLTSSCPFEGTTITDTLTRILTREPPPIRERRLDVPERLERLVSSLLQKKREDRLASAELLRDALAGRVDLPSPVVSRGRSPMIAAAVIAVIAIAAVTAGVLRVRHSGSSAVHPFAVADPCRPLGAAPPLAGEALMRELAGDQRVQVRSLASDGSTSLFEAASSAGARACITCSVTAEGDRLSLSVQIADPASRRVLWSRDVGGSVSEAESLGKELAGLVKNELAKLPTP